MANTFTLISSVTVGTNTPTEIDFSSIPATYTDLMMVVSTRTTVAFLDIKLNASTSNRSSRYLYGTGSTTGGGSQAGYLGVTSYSSDTASTFGSMSIYFPNYASTTTYKSFSADSVRENNASGGEQDLIAGLWSDNSAINQITIVVESSGTFAQYSTAYLYGIKNS